MKCPVEGCDKTFHWQSGILEHISVHRKQKADREAAAAEKAEEERREAERGLDGGCVLGRGVLDEHSRALAQMKNESKIAGAPPITQEILHAMCLEARSLRDAVNGFTACTNEAIL